MSFSSDIRNITTQYKGLHKDVINISLLKLSRSVLKMTPVGNPSLWRSGEKPEGYVGGRARSNWFAYLDSYATKTTEDTQYSFDQVEKITSKAAGSTFYLVNNLPYIGRLEFDGHSTQAPAGMLRVSIENFQLMLDKTIEELT